MRNCFRFAYSASALEDQRPCGKVLCSSSVEALVCLNFGSLASYWPRPWSDFEVPLGFGRPPTGGPGADVDAFACSHFGWQRKYVIMVAEPWQFVAADLDGELDQTAAASTEQPRTTNEVRWQRIVRRPRRIRCLQRCWGVLGGFLQSFPASLRDRLRQQFV